MCKTLQFLTLKTKNLEDYTIQVFFLLLWLNSWAKVTSMRKGLSWLSAEGCWRHGSRRLEWPVTLHQKSGRDSTQAPESQILAPSCTYSSKNSSLRGPITFVNNNTRLWPSVQIYKPVGNSSHLNIFQLFQHKSKHTDHSF